LRLVDSGASFVGQTDRIFQLQQEASLAPLAALLAGLPTDRALLSTQDPATIRDTSGDILKEAVPIFWFCIGAVLCVPSSPARLQWGLKLPNKPDLAVGHDKNLGGSCSGLGLPGMRERVLYPGDRAMKSLEPFPRQHRNQHRCPLYRVQPESSARGTTALAATTEKDKLDMTKYLKCSLCCTETAGTRNFANIES
jgi:hypothetical protein